MTVQEAVKLAAAHKTIIPAFNIPYLPMAEPVIRAIAVAGHESGGIGMSYEELFSSKKGFTDANEAKLFALKSGCDWLSVAVGSVHGAIAENTRKQKSRRPV